MLPKLADAVAHCEALSLRMTPLTPQADAVLNHLIAAGSVTAVEAAAVLRVRHLPARIFELSKAGYEITRTRRKDSTGQRYVRYGLAL